MEYTIKTDLTLAKKERTHKLRDSSLYKVSISNSYKAKIFLKIKEKEHHPLT